MVGVWSGIAVVALEVASTSGTTAAFRGIDVTTGEVLWTYDKVPDGEPFQVTTGMASDGRLAVGLARSDGAPGGPGNYVVIMSLTTGDVLSSRFYPEESTTEGSVLISVDTGFWSYEGGIVVISAMRKTAEVSDNRMCLANWVMTEAFEDTDLQTPLWQVESDTLYSPCQNIDVEAEWLRDSILGGQLGPTGAGSYVDIQTGTAAVMAWDDGNNSHAYTQAGDWLVDAVSTGAWGAYEATYLNGWNGPEAAAPTWTYAAPAQHVIDSAMCFSEDMLIVRTKTLSGLESSVSAIGLADGQLIWSIPFDWSVCGVIVQGDKEVVVLASGSEVKLLDSGDGTQLGTFKIQGDAGGRITSIEQCGEWLACVYADTLNIVPPYPFGFGDNDQLIVTAVAVGSAKPSSPWSVTVPPMTARPGRVYQTDAGLVIPTQPSPGVYEWLIV